MNDNFSPDTARPLTPDEVKAILRRRRRNNILLIIAAVIAFFTLSIIGYNDGVDHSAFSDSAEPTDTVAPTR